MSLGQLPLLTRGTFALFYGEEEKKISLTFTNLKKTNIGGEEIIEQLSVLPPGGCLAVFKVWRDEKLQRKGRCCAKGAFWVIMNRHCQKQNMLES